MSAPPTPDPRRPLRHIGLFLSPELQLARGIIEGFSAYALQHPEWILWPVPAGWDDVKRWVPVEFDAVVAFMGRPDSAEIFQRWSPRVINVSSRFKFADFASVLNDNAAVGRLAARHFLDRGFSEFACMATHGALYSEEREDGFRKELRSAGVKPRQIRTLWMNATAPAEEQPAMIETFMRSLPHPVAVFADSDWSALKLRRECWLRGYSVPDQVAILGVDNDPFVSQLGNAALSSIQLDGPRIGREAAARIERGFATGKWPAKTTLVAPVGVVERLSTEHSAVEDSIIRKALQFIRTQSVMGAGVDELCQHLAISRKTLDRRFKEHADCTPHELILKRRVEYARRLLRETDEKLEAVAYGSGFNDVRTFMRVFSRHEGATPAAYRKRFR